MIYPIQHDFTRPNPVETNGEFSEQQFMSMIATRIKKLLIRNPHLSVDQLQQILKNKGIRLSAITIFQIRTSFLSDLKLLTDLNLLTDMNRRKPHRSYQYGKVERPKRRKRHDDRPWMWRLSE